MNPSIHVKGAWAEIFGCPATELEECLTVLNPKRFYSKAFKEKRWDGKVRLYQGRTFPAGLVCVVVEHLHTKGCDVKVVGKEERKPVDPAHMSKDYLPPVGKFKEFWQPQFEAILAMLQNPRGVIKSPTGSGKTEMMCAVARYFWEERGWRSLIVVPKKGILSQTVERFERYYQGDIEVGMYGDGIKRPGDIAVGTAQTLMSFKPRVRKSKKKGRTVLPRDDEIKNMIMHYEVLFLDECLTGDALVATEDGMVRIDDPSIVSKKVFAFDVLDGILKLRSVKRWLCRGKKEVYRICLSNGSHVDATERTPFWTQEGWVMLRDLKLTDSLACAGVGRCSPQIHEDATGVTLGGTSVAAIALTGKSVWKGSPWADRFARAVVANVWEYPQRGRVKMCTNIPSCNASKNTTACTSCHNPQDVGSMTSESLQHLPVATSFLPVDSITPIGLFDTFDLEVNDLHSFVANGVVVHNCHHSSSDSWYEIALHSGAIRRYGLSGTPLKGDDIADMRMIGATGPILYDCDPQTLIDLNLAARPRIVMVMSDKVSGEELPVEHHVHYVKGQAMQRVKRKGYAEAYVEGVVENTLHNTAVVRACSWLVDNGKQTLVLCRRKAHWLYLKELLDGAGLDFRSVWGATETPERDEAKKLFSAGKINLILASTIFDEGEDVPSIEAIVLAEGVKVTTNVIQRVGRGMRRKAGDNDVWIVDFAPVCHKKLFEHALERVQAYGDEGYEVILWDKWPDADSDEDLLPFLHWDDAVQELTNA